MEGLYARRLLSPRSLHSVSLANLDAGSILFSNSISHNGLVSLFLFSRLGAIVDLMVEAVNWRRVVGRRDESGTRTELLAPVYFS